MITLTASKKYGERVVLDVENLAFEDGKRYALIGANGSGKSTLLKILARQIKPDKGATFVASGARECCETQLSTEQIGDERNVGKDIGDISCDNQNNTERVGCARVSGKDIDVCYMPQSSYAFALSVRRNVMIACPDAERLDKTVRREYRSRVERLIEKMGLGKLMKKDATKLSGGEMQRMALCRVMVKTHDLLLLDEPTSAMDVSATTTAEKVLSDYCAECNPTVVFATHSLKQAERLADEVIFLKDGRIVEKIDAKNLFAPKSDGLLEFIQNC